MKARLLGIAVKPQRLQPMQALEEAELSEAAGLAGDSRGKSGPRQVTLLSGAAWRAACDELGISLPWMERRANLLVNQLPLHNATGGRIVIGAVVLEITGETDPCSRMEAIHPGLFQALSRDWRGGVTCRVVRGGRLALGMDVDLEPPPGP
ncbi:MAG: MOSC domain-containing protein [Sulfuricellaceae bacterium]|nr:MOSC domain-containing protein [Sulfuricellaceae bacterium]